MMARRLSEASLSVLASPFRLMEKVGERVADYIIPDPAAQQQDTSASSSGGGSTDGKQSSPPSQPPPPPPPQAKPAQQRASGKRAASSPSQMGTKAVKRPATPKAGAPAAKSSRKSPPVKHEAMRDLPYRSSRHAHKAGFYNEKNLTAIAWRGTGTVKDPIRFD